MSQSRRPLQEGESFFSELQLSAWNISEDDFPAQGSNFEKLKFILHYAILAPSSHNTQPWIFNITDNEIEVYANRTRALPVVDPDDRALIISCGAALYHIRLALHHFGYMNRVELFPLPGNVDLVARITATEGSSIKAGRLIEKKHGYDGKDSSSSLFYAITKRRTNRSPFEQRKISANLLSSLKIIAE